VSHHMKLTIGTSIIEKLIQNALSRVAPQIDIILNQELQRLWNCGFGHESPDRHGTNDTETHEAGDCAETPNGEKQCNKAPDSLLPGVSHGREVKL